MTRDSSTRSLGNGGNHRDGIDESGDCHKFWWRQVCALTQRAGGNHDTAEEQRPDEEQQRSTLQKMASMRLETMTLHSESDRKQYQPNTPAHIQLNDVDLHARAVQTKYELGHINLSHLDTSQHTRLCHQSGIAMSIAVPGRQRKGALHLKPPRLPPLCLALPPPPATPAGMEYAPDLVPASPPCLVSSCLVSRPPLSYPSIAAVE